MIKPEQIKPEHLIEIEKAAGMPFEEWPRLRYKELLAAIFNSDVLSQIEAEHVMSVSPMPGSAVTPRVLINRVTERLPFTKSIIVMEKGHDGGIIMSNSTEILENLLYMMRMYQINLDDQIRKL